MLTQKDTDEIEKTIDQKLDQKIKLLPTKDEFFTKMDEVMGELQTISPPFLVEKPIKIL